MPRLLKTPASLGPTPLTNCTGVSGLAGGAFELLVTDFDDVVADLAFGGVDDGFIAFLLSD